MYRHITSFTFSSRLLKFLFPHTCAVEIVKVIKDSPAVTRQIVLKRLLSGEVCDRPVFHNHKVAYKDTMTSSCKQLLEDHHEEFSEVLLSEEPKNLEITMCYELSSSCVGVKHQSFTVSY
ncbi:hypothetical protein N1851_021396 [Merluccius polli]|uniref:DUF3456 domain-containing protein n=1 Tax=Merluccius polli TaxID=89951 RepID=A0AA47NZF5_MERPO|nr:hypothetical protein N1851_021396 [Merluccius polli]